MITGVTPFAENLPQTPTTGDKQSMGKDDFLQLLVAQLSAQDPLNPLESQDFSAQLAQFSSLEQITNVNTTLKEIRDSQQEVNNSAMIQLIGNKVDVPGDLVNKKSGQENTLSYALEGEASAVFVEVFDKDGAFVTSLNGETAAGTHFINWDGTNGEGEVVKEGVYKFKVKATDENGDPVASKTFTSGKVTDIVFENGQVFALVNGQKLPAQDISRVSVNI